MRLNKNSNNSNNRSALAEPSDDDFEADENSNPSQNDTLNSDKKSLNQIERTCPKCDKVFLTAAGKINIYINIDGSEIFNYFEFFCVFEI